MLLNNAGIAEIGRSYEGLDMWKAVMDVNLFGYVSIPRFFCGRHTLITRFVFSVLNVQHTFVPVRLFRSFLLIAFWNDVRICIDDALSGEPFCHHQHGI